MINVGKIVNVTPEIAAEFGLSKNVGSVVRMLIAHLVRIASMINFFPDNGLYFNYLAEFICGICI